MFNNIMYTTLYTADQDRALRWYTECLGLEKRVDYSGPEGRFLTVGVTDSPVEIILWTGDAEVRQPPGAPEPGTVPGPVILESADLKSDVEILRNLGVTFEEPEPVDYAFGVRITAIDPDGNRISLREQRRRGGSS
jgi:catechol 2,3-dioxygenase-like lactoylglutathione lyase family enzyme